MSNKAAPKKKEGGGGEPMFDLEQQFILRLPPGPAMALRRDIQSGSMTLKDKLSITLQPDMRHGHVTYGGEIFNSKLLDLPCMVDSLKTVDQKTFYKTADVCQILVCTTEEDTTVDENENPRKKDKDKKFVWNHGITAPLKNVKKRRFRKTLKKKYMDQPEIENEIKRLFRYDADSIDVKWEVVAEDEKPSEENQSEVVEASGTVTTSDAHILKRSETMASLDVALFGELSSSEDEEDKDINIMDSGEDEISQGPFMSQASFSIDGQTPTDSQMEMTADANNDELQLKLKELIKQLTEIREKRSNQETQLATIDNIALKERMQADLDHLLQEESEKEREFEILSSMLNQ